MKIDMMPLRRFGDSSRILWARQDFQLPVDALGSWCQDLYRPSRWAVIMPPTAPYHVSLSTIPVAGAITGSGWD